MAGYKWRFRIALLSTSAVLVMLSISGCVKATEDGSGTVYTFERYVFELVLLAAFAAALIGWVLQRRGGRIGAYGWSTLAFGFVLLVVLAPALWSDYIRVDAQGFELKTGLWFSPTHHMIDFNKLTSIALTDEIRSGRNGKRTNYFLVCEQHAGPSEKVPVGDMMKKALDDILQRANEHGVIVMDQQDGR